MEWRYSTKRHAAGTITGLAADYSQTLDNLIGHCLSGDADGASPADFPLSDLDQDALLEIEEQLRDVDER